MAMTLILSLESAQGGCGSVLARLSLCAMSGVGLAGCISPSLTTSRSPHFQESSDLQIAYLGDSTGTTFVGGPRPIDLVRAFFRLGDGNAITDDRPGDLPISPFERVCSEIGPCEVTNYSRPGSSVFLGDAVNIPPKLVRDLLDIPSLDELAQRVSATQEAPQVIAILTGHNDIFEWNTLFESEDGMIPAMLADIGPLSMADIYHERMSQVLQQLIYQSLSQKNPRPTSLVVFGLFDFDGLVAAKEELKAKKKNLQSLTELNAARYQHRIPLEQVGASTMYLIIPEKKGSNTTSPYKAMGDLQRLYNRSLKELVQFWNSELQEAGLDSLVQLTYSDEISRLALDPSLLAEDGTHPNDLGRTLMSESLFRGLKPGILWVREMSENGIGSTDGGLNVRRDSFVSFSRRHSQSQLTRTSADYRRRVYTPGLDSQSP